MIYRISINRQKVRGYVGVFADEKINGNVYEVSVSADIVRPDTAADDVSATLNYADISTIITRIMTQPLDLIETAAYDIGCSVARCADGYDIDLCKVTVRVAKFNPPIPDAVMESASVEVTLDKPYLVSKGIIVA